MKITLCNLSKKWTKKVKTNLEYLRKYQEFCKRLPLDLLGHCLLVTLTRKSCPELFHKKKIFKTLLNSQENSYVRVTFLMKLQNL